MNGQKPCVLHFNVAETGNGSNLRRAWDTLGFVKATGNSVEEAIKNCQRISCDVIDGQFGVHTLSQIMDSLPFGQSRNKCVVVTEIRDPVEQMFAVFDGVHGTHAAAGAPIDTLRTFAQATQFANGVPDCSHLNSAMRNLATRSHLVMTDESIGASFDALLTLFGSGNSASRRGSTGGTFSSLNQSVGPKMWEVARAATSLDQVLYNHGRRVAQVQRGAIFEAERQIEIEAQSHTELVNVVKKTTAPAHATCEFSDGHQVSGCSTCNNHMHPPVAASHASLLNWHSTRLGGPRYIEVFAESNRFRACEWHACDGLLNSPWVARFDLTVGTSSYWQMKNSAAEFYVRHGLGFIDLETFRPKTVHVKSDALPRFVDKILPRLPSDCRFALYVGDGDLTIMRMGVDVPALVNDVRVRAIFTENNDAPPELNVTAMPLGFHPKQLLLSDLDARHKASLLPSQQMKKAHGVVGGWSPWGDSIFHTRHDRPDAKKWMLQNPSFATFVEKLSQEEFWDVISAHRFFLSPLGLTYDGFKMFEALALGSIPIIQRLDHWAEAYDDLPVVMIDSWDDITPAAMEAWWDELSPKLPSVRERLGSEYWWSKISAAADGRAIPRDKMMVLAARTTTAPSFSEEPRPSSQRRLS